MSFQLGLRLGLAVSALIVLVLWEVLAPRRPLRVSRASRWTANLGLFAIGAAVLLCLGSSLTLVEAAKAFEVRRIGLLNLTSWPYPVKFILGFVLLDLTVYAQHWAFHAVPWLWRVHRVHHTDLDLDATTGLRFHPVELLLSLFLKLAACALWGVHFLAAAVFEIALNLTALFNHADVRIPGKLDRVLRRLVVTPDMHRVHHSVRASERDSNFGFNLPWWDHLLGTYEADSAEGPILCELGLPEHRDPGRQGLAWLLTLPFK